MSTPADHDIPAGARYRALSDVELLVKDYDDLQVATRVLVAGSLFQPWEPREHWRGRQVPITLGEGCERFDWGVTSPRGHFLSWNDFFSKCGPKAQHPEWYRPAQPAPGLVRPSDRFFDRDVLGRTPLFAAAAMGRKEEVDAMLRSMPGTGFYPQRLGFLEIRDQEGLTAADFAEQCGEKEIAEDLRYRAWAMETFG